MSEPRPHNEPSAQSEGVPKGTPEGAETAEHKQRWLPKPVKVVLVGLAGLLSLVVVLLLAALLLLQTGWGARKAGDLIAGLANPYEDATLTIGDVEGTWLGSLRLFDVNLVRTDSASGERVRMAHLDSLKLRYDLPALLTSRLHVREVDLSGLDVRARQQPDSTWDLLQPFGGAQETDTSQSAFAVQVDDLTVRDSRLTAQFYAPGRDSTLRVRSLDAQVDGLLLGDSLAADLKALTMRFTPPSDPVTRTFSASAALTGSRLQLRRLNLNSPYSTLRGRGTLLLPGEGVPAQDVDFRLAAQPLDFRDIAPFVPGLDPAKSATLDLRVTGSGRLLDARLEAQLSDDATLEATAEVTPDTDGPLVYRADGQLRNFNPAFFSTSDSATAGRINADFAADLEGPAFDRIDGTASLDLFDTQIAGYAPGRTRLNADFTDGRADLDFATSLRGAQFSAAGTARPFDPAPSYDLQARFSNVDLGALAADTAQSSDLNGALTLAGEGASLDEADLTARLQLLPSTLNRFRLEPSRLTARLENGDLTFDAQLRSPQGQVIARGGAEGLATDAPRYRITQGEIQNLDVASLTGDTTRSQFSGTFHLDGRGTDPQTLTLSDAQLRLRDSYYGPYMLAAADLDAVLADGRLNAQARADLQDAGRFRLTATARPFDDVPTFAVTEGAFEHVDLGALAADTAQSSDLSGTFRLDGAGTDPRAMALDASLALGASRLNQQPIDEAALETTLRQGRLDYALQLDLPEGQSRLAGSARPFGNPITYAVDEGVLRGLNLGALAGLPSLQTNLNANFQLDGRGTDPETAALEARLDLARSTINDEVVQDGALRASLSGGAARLQTSAALSQGRIALTGQAAFRGEEPQYQAEGRFEDIDLGRLAGTDTLDAGFSLTFDVQGTGTDPAAMRLDGRVRSDAAHYESLRLTAFDVPFRLEDGLLRLDSLRLRSNVATADGGGQIAVFDTTARYPSDFELTARLFEPEPLRSLLGADIFSLQDAELAVRAAGPPGTLRLEADASLESLVYNTYQLAGFEAAVTGTLGDGFSIARGTANAKINYLGFGETTVQNADLSAALAEDSTVTFQTNLVLDQERTLNVAGAADLRPGVQQVQVENLALRLGDARWNLLQPATVSYGEAYRVSGLLLTSGTQQIAVDGVVDPDGRQSLILTIEGFETEAVTDLAGFDGLGGPLSGTLALTGPAEAPLMDGTLGLDITSYGEPAGTLQLALDYEDLRLGVDAQLTHRDGSTLSAEGSLPLDLRLAEQADSAGVAPEVLPGQELDVAVNADAFSIGWARPFLDPTTVNRLDGQLTGALEIGGTLSAPQLTGEAALADAALGLPDLGVTYRDINAAVQFTDDRILLERARMRSDGGRLTAEGAINLTDLTLGQFDLSITANDFQAIANSLVRARADADLRVSGTTDQPVMTGDVRVLSADFYLDQTTESADVAEVQLSEDDARVLRERFGVSLTEADTTTSDAYLALAMRLDVTLDRDVWLRSSANPGLAIQFTGDLDVQKESGEDLQLFGGIEVISERSYVEQFGKRFNITSGTLSFNGPATDPVLDVEAAYGVPARGSPGQNEITITLGVTGRLDDLDLTLGSEPQASNADIVSYIATGRPADEAFKGGSGSSGGGGNAATNLAASQAAGILEGLVGSGAGLDVIEIETSGFSGATLTAGKYVTPRFYVAVRQPVSRSSNTAQAITGTEVTLEYELTSWLLARLTGGAGETSTLRANLQFEYAY